MGWQPLKNSSALFTLLSTDVSKFSLVQCFKAIMKLVQIVFYHQIIPGTINHITRKQYTHSRLKGIYST